MHKAIERGLRTYFYLGMGLLVLAVVLLGFLPRLDKGLLHPELPPPFILYLHSAVFSAWVIILIAQSLLARSANVQLHRRLGWSGVAVGAVLPFLGIATALVMQKWRAAQGPENPAFLAVSFNDMLSFGITFALAVYWRKRIEYHRRLMVMATCCLSVAAIARFPAGWVPAGWWYAGVDLLIILGVARDWLVQKRVHAVYRYGLPCLVVGQLAAMYLFLEAPPAWMSFTNSLVA
ncbi:hypothetical protein [Pseudoduganella violacea]|uniref:FtsH-binding integral membrane protein n=1 Tax=Pseudoduganella violacea TaxID=1715466 RepID=A0A7W5BCD1_9BURK|nr:hypothetical protein [Pseudoduganella violacea]MBB3120378.1 FtsH-binding integral membrane protein [Pseudoduganella violacea]